MAQSDGIPSGQLPLKGVVLCCTSLSQDDRTKLADIAIQMGALHKLDLTSDVTHLVVGSITTPKYRYVAKDRPDIKVLHPRWIEAVREFWLEGGDVDVKALEMAHRVSTFHGLHVCVTGFDDLNQRNYISSTVIENGAAYHGDLTKLVTHLIAAAPQGAKYKHAKEWGIGIVSLKWFQDSLRRGMALEESLYDPLMPLEEQGKGAFKEHVRPRTSLGKRGRGSETQNAGGADLGKKKLRRTASTRLESQSQDMWQDISAREASLEGGEGDQWRDDEPRTTSHISETSFRTKTLDNRSASRLASELYSETSQGAEGLFSGVYVLVHGFELKKTDLLQHYLIANGAQLVQSPSELEGASANAFFKDRYLLIPRGVSGSPPKISEVPPGTKVATEWWVERCIHYKRLLDPSEDVLSSPLSHVEISGFSDLSISTTGFAGVDLRQVAEVVKQMGATYQEKILPSSSVLVSGGNTIKKEKAFYANKHQIPVVSAAWLWTCLKTRRQAPFDKFKVQLPAFDPKDFVGEPSTSSPAPSDMLQRQPSGANTKNDDSLPKRLSNIRKRHATLSFSLQASKASTAATLPRPQPIVHEDKDVPLSTGSEPLPAPTTAAPSRAASQPLQEVSPNLSPRKPNGRSEEHEQDVSMKKAEPINPRSRTVSPAKPGSPPRSPSSLLRTISNSDARPPARPHRELTANLAELLSKSLSSRSSSAAGSQPPQKRKNRPLGRALSGISNRSASAQSQTTSPALPTEVADSAADGFSFAYESPLPPSTQLGYETPEAEAHRLQMSKKMGTKLHDDGGMRRVASLGTVKDSSLGADSGVGNRLRGRQRAK